MRDDTGRGTRPTPILRTINGSCRNKENVQHRPATPAVGTFDEDDSRAERLTYEEHMRSAKNRVPEQRQPMRTAVVQYELSRGREGGVHQRERNSNQTCMC